MARVKGSVATRARRKKILKKAEGYFGSRPPKNKFSTDITMLMHPVVIVRATSVSFGLSVLTLAAVLMASPILSSSMA